MSSRRIGKTWTACVLAVEAALRTPFARVAFAFPTQKMARNTVIPAMALVLEDCPPSLRPHFNQTEMVWRFPHNGSIIVLSGCDDKNAADSLRGTKLDFGVVDEAGFHKHLDYVLKSVLLPQTLTTNGRVLIISSPPTSPSHELRKIYLDAVADGAATKHTVEVAVPYLPGGWDTVREFVDEAGGPESTQARREYYAELVTDETMAVVPEFVKARTDLVLDMGPPPPYRDLYVSADFGFNDLTAVVFAYYDFQKALIVIEDEIVVQRMSAIEVCNLIKQREAAIWPDRVKEPFRFADAPLQMLADIAGYGGVPFGPVRKDDKMAALNELRMACLHKQFRIHPRCTTTIEHLENAVWTANRATFERSGKHGHFDCVDAMIYLLRHVTRNSNPYPVLPDGVHPSTHHVPAHLLKGGSIGRQGLVEAFRPRKIGSYHE